MKNPFEQRQKEKAFNFHKNYGISSKKLYELSNVKENQQTMFPDKKYFTPKKQKISVWFDNEFKYYISSAEQLNNIRIWAVQEKMTDRIKLVWHNQTITLNKYGDLSDFPYGMLNTVERQLVELVKLKRKIDEN